MLNFSWYIRALTNVCISIFTESSFASNKMNKMNYLSSTKIYILQFFNLFYCYPFYENKYLYIKTNVE